MGDGVTGPAGRPVLPRVIMDSRHENVHATTLFQRMAEESVRGTNGKQKYAVSPNVQV